MYKAKVLINTLIIVSVFVCIFISLLTQGLISAALDLIAFFLLVTYIFRFKTKKLSA